MAQGRVFISLSELHNTRVIAAASVSVCVCWAVNTGTLGPKQVDYFFNGYQRPIADYIQSTSAKHIPARQPALKDTPVPASLKNITAC